MGNDDGGFYALIVLAIILGAVAIGTSPKGCATSQQSPDQTDLIVLPSPPFDVRSAATSDLLDPGYWAMVRASAANTTAYLVHDTAVGFSEEYRGWGNWTLSHMPDAPKWAGTGFTPYANSELYVLQAQALSSGNATKAAGVLEYQASKVAGLSLATADYVSLNSVSALRTYFETSSVIRAVCTTYPAQLGQLWREAFDSGLPREQRANLLGRALAVTTFVVAMAGADGFSPKLKVALDKVGLADSWATIKPHLGKIGSVISERASYLTFSLLQKLAARFPQSSVWVTGLTADRIDSMAEVLHEKGFSNDVIEQRIQDLTQAAGDSPNGDGAATGADETSYRDGGEIIVRLSSENQIFLYADGQRTQYITSQFLQDVVPGFKAGTPTSLKVTYLETGLTFYHYYLGKDNWVPTAPDFAGHGGDIIAIRIEVLTTQDFVKSLPDVELTNTAQLNWLADSSTITGYALKDDVLTMAVTQSPSIEGVSNFIVTGIAKDALGARSGITYLQFQITDVFGIPRDLRISYDGNDPPYLGVFSSPDYSPVFMVSSDGVRLRFASSAGGSGTEVATIYMQEPPALYTSSSKHAGDPAYKISGASAVYQIDEVTPVRSLEVSMRDHGGKYDLARLGEEVAYKVGKENFGLNDIVLVEPSQSGADLYTSDGKAVIQARMLDQRLFQQGSWSDYLKGQLADMVKTIITKDFKINSSATTGYVVLSYIDINNSIQVIILEVPRT